MDRLFFAVELDENTRQEIAARAAKLKGLWAQARWVQPHNYHITLLFIGRYPGPIEDLERAGHQAAQAPQCTLTANRWGCFPNKQRPRVGFAAVEDEGGVLGRIHNALSSVSQGPKRTNFRAHITVARSRGGGVMSWPLPDFGPPVRFACRHVTLFNSELTAEGPRYAQVGRFNLRDCQ